MSTGEPVYKRIVLKLSGEMLGGSQGAGLDYPSIQGFGREVQEVIQAGVQVALVIGGGNLVRGAQAVGSHGLLQRATGDCMGMLATVINALALQDALQAMGVEARAMSALHMPEVCESFVRREALRHLEQGRVVILAGGLGAPFFTTDTAAAQRALELDAEIVLKGTKVDGVYSDDPVKNPHAQRYTVLSFQEVLEKDLKVMDATAIALCRDHDLPILVFSMLRPGNILRAISGEGETIGTLVVNT
jgi:uridylate kinase